MYEKVRNLVVVIPEIARNSLPSDMPVLNINPQSAYPFAEISCFYDENYCNMHAIVAPVFLAQLAERPSPHLSYTHIGLMVDGIATASFPAMTGEAYGREYRYLEAGILTRFHCEPWVKGVRPKIPRGAIEVDSLSITWEFTPIRDRIPLLHRGYFRAAVFGQVDADSVHVASWEGEYFRSKVGSPY